MRIRPDNFKDDPYGYLTNQIGHIFLGFSAVSYYTWVLDFFVSWPNQAVAVVIITTIYFFWVELILQGWRGLDTVEDTLYTFGGASLYLFIDMSLVIDKITFCLTLLLIALALGILRRVD